TMDGEDLPPPIDRRAEALDPGLVGRGIHPVDAAYNWRVVHEDCRRHVRRVVEPGHEPGLPRLAERSAVTTGFGRIEQDYTQALALDDIVHEPFIGPHLREGAKQAFARVVIADHRPDRERAFSEQRGGFLETPDVA